MLAVLGFTAASTFIRNVPGATDMNGIASGMSRLVAAVSLAIGFFAGGTSSAAVSERPLNVVFFLVDDLGWTDLGCFGSDFYRTPNIDKLAAAGTRFTQNYSACNACSPTRGALMTGMYPARTHLAAPITSPKEGPMPEPKARPRDFAVSLVPVLSNLKMSRNTCLLPVCS